VTSLISILETIFPEAMTASRRSLLVTGAVAGIDISWALPGQQLARMEKEAARPSARQTGFLFLRPDQTPIG
jgi:hypothetical protein